MDKPQSAERIGKLIGHAAAGIVIIVILLVLVSLLGSDISGIWQRIPAWDWKQVVVISAAIVGIAIMLRG